MNQAMDGLPIESSEDTPKKYNLHPALIANLGKGRPKGAKNKTTLLAIKEIKEADLFCKEITPEHIKRFKRMIEFKQLAKVAEKLDSAKLDDETEIKLRLDTARTVKTDPQEYLSKSIEISLSSADILAMRELLGKGENTPGGMPEGSDNDE